MNINLTFSPFLYWKIPQWKLIWKWKPILVGSNTRLPHVCWLFFEVYFK